VVRKNDTLHGIARKYGTSAADLKAYNNISNPDLLLVGSKLKICSKQARNVTYVVRKGDSLAAVASRFGVKTSTLARINRISRPDLIRVGRKLTVPAAGGTAPSRLPAVQRQALAKIRPTPKKWTKIVIHHSATPVDDAVNMHRVHEDRGMENGLAYHFVISNGSRKASDGEIYISKRWKDQLDGGHVKKLAWNQTCIGICLIGNFELRPPTTKQLDALLGLCEYLMEQCNISAEKVTTHKILHPGHTVCPGKNFSLSAFSEKISSR